MKSRAALLFDQPGKWQVADVEVDPPGPFEVLVRMVACGLCHSDDHVAKADGKISHFPYCGGHEGAGVIEAVGSGVRGLRSRRPHRHVLHPGLRALQLLRPRHAEPLRDRRRSDPQAPSSTAPSGCTMGPRRRPLLPDRGVLGVQRDVRSGPAFLCRRHSRFEPPRSLGCGVPTGWGSAVNAAEVRPGQVIIVMGVGGIGINAVQGAAHAGREPGSSRSTRWRSSATPRSGSGPPTRWLRSRRRPSWPGRSPTVKEPTRRSSPSGFSRASTSARASTRSARRGPWSSRRSPRWPPRASRSARSCWPCSRSGSRVACTG